MSGEKRMRIGIKCGPTMATFEAFDLDTGRVIPTIKCSIDDISTDAPLLTATLRIPIESLVLSDVAAMIEPEQRTASPEGAVANGGFVPGGLILGQSSMKTFTADEPVKPLRRGPDGNLEVAPNE